MKLAQHLALTCVLALIPACSEPASRSGAEAGQQAPRAGATAYPARVARATLQVAGVAENPDAPGVLMLPLRYVPPGGDGEMAVVGPLLDLEVARAEATVDVVGYPAVQVELEPVSRKAFHELTARHVDRQVAVVVDGVVVSAPVVNEPLAGSWQIAGRFTPEEAADLVRDLQGAAR